MAPVWVPTERTRLNVAPTVQLLPGARFTPVQLSAPLVQVQTRPAPVTLTAVTATLDPPAAAVFVSVTTAVLLSVPLGSVIVSGLGAIDTVAFAATPAPVSATGDPVTVAPV
jgi:hypothetical protein